MIGGALAIGSFSYALALYTAPASNVSFGISQATAYYLKGSFNSWAQENTYKFINNTAEMSPEANKIKEFKLENIPLNKDVELKVWGDNDIWYKDGTSDCTYEHHWSNATCFSDNEDHNYIVPMTSNTYTFYLKFYNDGSSKVFVTANKDILYFVPSERWKGADATFAIEQYNSESQWVSNVTDSVESPTGTYKFVLGTTNPKYKFARRDTTNENTWNASNIQTISNADTNNCFELWDSYYEGGEIWSNWDPVGGTTKDVSTGVWSTK